MINSDSVRTGIKNELYIKEIKVQMADKNSQCVSLDYISFMNKI